MRTPPIARRARRPLATALLGAALAAASWCPPASPPVPASAQFVVSDPTNLYQNTMGALSELESMRQTIESVRMQAETVKREIRNMRKLDPTSWRDLVAAVESTKGLIERGERIGRQWERMGDDFDRVYGRYGPNDYKGDDYKEARRRWRETSNDAAADLRRAQAEVAQVNAKLARSTLTLEQEAQAVEGALEAAQLTTRTLGVMARQNQALIEMTTQDSRAKAALQAEKRRAEEAARARAKDAIGAGFGEYETQADPVKLPELD